MQSSKVYPFQTSDRVIRNALLRELYNSEHLEDPNTVIVEELGLKHGEIRVDIAVVNGIIHGYELKSDLDTFVRLPDQMKVYNSVLDKVTLVVGNKHAHQAINFVPDWWGIMLAKVNTAGHLNLIPIREAEDNPNKDMMSIARLLWKQEAIDILEKVNQCKRLHQKSRDEIFNLLIGYFSFDELREKVRDCIRSRVKN